MFQVGCAVRTEQCATDLEHLYRIYSIPTRDKHQWLLLQFIVLLKMDTKGVRNIYSIRVVVNKHNTARVASCWFIIYYTTSALWCSQSNWCSSIPQSALRQFHRLFLSHFSTQCHLLLPLSIYSMLSIF